MFVYEQDKYKLNLVNTDALEYVYMYLALNLTSKSSFGIKEIII